MIVKSALIQQFNYLMGKQRKSQKVQNKEDQSEKFGRPIDNDIQIRFMSKIRGAKLQLINAESELQLQFSFNDITKKIKKSRKRVEQDLQTCKKIEGQQTCEDLQKYIISNFKEVNSDKKTKLLQKYNSLHAAWKFEEIQAISQLPKYLFEDGNDLSFILHSLNIEKIKILDIKNPTTLTLKETTPLKPQELFLYGLLCLNGRNYLSYNFINKLLQRSSLVIRLIKYGLDLLNQQMKEKQKKGEPLTFYQQKYSCDLEDENQQQELNESQNQNQSQSKSKNGNKREKGEKSNSISKKKIILKQTKIKKQKSSRSERKNESQDEEFPKRVTQEDKIQTLIQKLVSYIVWSYKYVFDEQLKLRNKHKKVSTQILDCE